jgi:hypothetical protein
MMGKAGQLEIAVNSVGLADRSSSVALSAVKRTQGDGHGVAVGVTTGVVALVFWPAAPFMLMRHGNDIQIAGGTEVSAYTAMDATLKLEPLVTAPTVAIAPVTPVTPVIAPVTYPKVVSAQ